MRKGDDNEDIPGNSKKEYEEDNREKIWKD